MVQYFGENSGPVTAEFIEEEPMICGGLPETCFPVSLTCEMHFNELDSNLIGTDIAERLVGYDDADTIRGNGGNDIILSGRGVDTVYGGEGDDTIFIIPGGASTFEGGEGCDTFELSGEVAAFTDFNLITDFKDCDIFRFESPTDGVKTTVTFAEVDALIGHDEASATANQFFVGILPNNGGGRICSASFWPMRNCFTAVLSN